MTSSWCRSESAYLHDDVVAFIADFVEHRLGPVQDIADLWVASGQMLSRLAARLTTSTAVGLCDRRQTRHSATTRTSGQGRVTYRLADPADPQAKLPSRLDVVVGMPPWHWAPRRMELADLEGGTVRLTEDPANVAMVHACRRLRPGGLGVFIVGPGVLMRPGPGTLLPNLQRLGLHIDGVIAIPRGGIQPDHGAAQVVFAMSQVQREPLVGSMKLRDDAFSDFMCNQLAAGPQRTRSA
jgi:hypothetical protein